MSEQSLTPDNIVEQGEKIYEERIRDTLTDEDKGKFVVIDVISGAFAIAEDDITASDALVQEGSCGETLYGLRVGHQTAYKIGRQALSRR